MAVSGSSWGYPQSTSSCSFFFHGMFHEININQPTTFLGIPHFPSWKPEALDIFGSCFGGWGYRDACSITRGWCNQRAPLVDCRTINSYVFGMKYYEIPVFIPSKTLIFEMCWVVKILLVHYLSMQTSSQTKVVEPPKK